MVGIMTRITRSTVAKDTVGITFRAIWWTIETLIYREVGSHLIKGSYNVKSCHTLHAECKFTCNILPKYLWHSWDLWCSSRCLQETRTLVMQSWTCLTPLISEQFPPPISFWCSFCFSVKRITPKADLMSLRYIQIWMETFWKLTDTEWWSSTYSSRGGGQCSSVSNDSSVTWPQDKGKKVLKIMQLFEERLCELVRSFNCIMWLRPDT